MSRVLVVENNSEELMQLISFLEKKFQIIGVSSGEECYAALCDELPDIIIVDDMLLEPNCYEICRTLKADPNTGSIPIILMSDLDASDLAQEIDFIGVDDYLCKPVKKEEAVEKINTLVAFSAANTNS